MYIPRQQQGRYLVHGDVVSPWRFWQPEDPHRKVQETPFEPEPSAEGIKAIIIKAMRDEDIRPCHIPSCIKIS